MNQRYEAYRKNKIESGLLYQDFVVDVMAHTVGLVIQQYASRTYQWTVGESRTGVEIKHDEQYRTTGNLWIETAEKARPRAGDYVPAGIYRNDNAWLYVIGDYDTIFCFSKQLLKALASSGRYPIRENKTRTSQGYLLPSDHNERYAALLVRPNAHDRVAKVVGNLESLGRVLQSAVLSNPSQGSLFDKFVESTR